MTPPDLHKALERERQRAADGILALTLIASLADPSECKSDQERVQMMARVARNALKDLKELPL